MLWCGLGGEGAVREKPKSTHAARERHERNESPLSPRTDSRRPSSIGTEDHVAVFPEHQDEPSSAATYLAAGSVVSFIHGHGFSVCLRALGREAERRCGLRIRPASASRRLAESQA